jgi:protein-disulfide isomerase
VTSRTIAAIALSCFFAVACESAATTTPSKSPVDVSELSTRERATLERMVDESMAPCPEQAVTLDVCLNEKRACNACPLAAQFLVERVKSGLDKTAIRESYKKRFTAEAKQIELGDSPSLGPANAAVTIVIWSDFECPHCQHVVPIIERLQEAHANDVRLVHKFYPLPRHTNAKIAARAAWAAQQQGKYWELEKLLFENQKKLGEQTILELAASLGLDMARVRVDMDGDGATNAIARDMAEAEKHGLDGTPFVMINGREFDLQLFQAEQDLETWVTTEIELAKGK